MKENMPTIPYSTPLLETLWKKTCQLFHIPYSILERLRKNACQIFHIPHRY
jgi:hypothetical protein